MEDFYEGAAIVELMGHTKITGMVSKSAMGLLRVDAVDPLTGAPITKYYNPSAIYCMTPITQESLKMVAEMNVPKPIGVWDIPQDIRAGLQKQLEAKSISDEDEYPFG